jgi:hypothetical protein
MQTHYSIRWVSLGDCLEKVVCIREWVCDGLEEAGDGFERGYCCGCIFPLELAYSLQPENAVPY